GAILARLERPRGAHDLAVLELLRVLAEVPDVSVFVLGVPVERLLFELAARKDPVQHRDYLDTEDGLVVAGHFGDHELRLALPETVGQQTAARWQRKERVVHSADEVVRIEVRQTGRPDGGGAGRCGRGGQ